MTQTTKPDIDNERLQMSIAMSVARNAINELQETLTEDEFIYLLKNENYLRTALMEKGSSLYPYLYFTHLPDKQRFSCQLLPDV